jgi:hypothetical protein
VKILLSRRRIFASVSVRGGHPYEEHKRTAHSSISIDAVLRSRLFFFVTLCALEIVEGWHFDILFDRKGEHF